MAVHNSDAWDDVHEAQHGVRADRAATSYVKTMVAATHGLETRHRGKVGV